MSKIIPLNKINDILWFLAVCACTLLCVTGDICTPSGCGLKVKSDMKSCCDLLSLTKTFSHTLYLYLVLFSQSKGVSLTF